MRNIDFFKQDIHVGDIAIVELTSGKSVKGKVLEIGEFVMIMKEDGKKMRLLDGIIGGWELVEKASQEEDVKIDLIKTDDSIDEKDKKVERAEAASPEVEDKIPQAQQPQETSKPKLVHLGNSLDALSTVFDDVNNEENAQKLTPLGQLKKIGPKYSFIADYKSGQDILVPGSEIVDKSVTSGCLVVYSYSKNNKGIIANAVHRASSVADALEVAQTLSETGDLWKALEVLKHILDLYPKNVDASSMSKSIKSNLSGKNPRKNNKTKSDRTTSQVAAQQSTIPFGEYPEKPQVIDAAETRDALPLKLPKMTDMECREKERELDALIRNGEREKCLESSYQLLAHQCPTPKYLRSYLDRITNTEVALNHTKEAIFALAQLIYFSENQPDTKAANLAHLYVSLARLFRKDGQKGEAEKALNCAEYLGANNSVVQSLREQMSVSNGGDSQDLSDLSSDIQSSIETDVALSVSKMLQQDIEQAAASLNGEEDPENLLRRAMRESQPSSNKTFEVKAQFFLEAAACYWIRKEYSKSGYKNAVANYARMKGDAMFTMLQNTIHMFPENKESLLAYSDSACSYYTEALGIFNELRQGKFLQELFLKYLKLRRVSSQILGGKTPDSEWHSGTLKAMMQDCLSGDNPEDLKAFVYTCISVGASTEAAWNSLSNDVDGIRPFFGRLSDDRFRMKTFELFNELEGSNVSVVLKAAEFLHTVFLHRQQRNELLYAFLTRIAKWDFDPIDISSISDEWTQVEDFSGILLPSDGQTCSNIGKVIKILSDYTEADPIYRHSLLIQAQQVIQKSVKEIAETTTYLGRVFFSPLESKWLDKINEHLTLYFKSQEPRLRIIPDPATIHNNEEAGYSIVFRVCNVGETPATSFSVQISDSQGRIWPSIDAERLSVGEEKVIQWVIPEQLVPLVEQDSRISLTVEATPLYQGRTLNSSKDVFVFEIESSEPLSRDDMPWMISNTPPDNIFKGRDEDLIKLEKHYRSRERVHTYILYGLTRTGKTSLLEYLRGRLKGVALDENPKVTILPFSWDFNHVAFKKDLANQFWENLVKIQIYDELSPELKKAVNKAYPLKRFPDVVTQNDFLRIIDALNSKGVHPFITIDEFSNVKDGIEDGMLNAAFLGVLRDLALTGKASFIYAGTYDIKELPKDPKYGYTGQLTHTRQMPINAIKEKYANELIDASSKLHFEEDAKAYIRYLSGCIPYWIQWICMNCGKYAVIKQKHYLGVHDVDEVVRIMTGETRDDDDVFTWQRIDEINFQNNQVMTDGGKQAEEALISSIAYLNRERTRSARGISTKELDILWEKNAVSKVFQGEMLDAIKRMKERDTLIEETEENRLVYRLAVDLFRRCWYVNHKNISAELAHK